MEVASALLLERVEAAAKGCSSKLDLSSLSLSNLPAELFQPLQPLPTVTLLDLSNNSLTDLPQSLAAALPRLQELNLKDNNLQRPPWSLFAGLAELESLNLSGNKLLSVPSHTSLPQLKRLDLSSNQLKALPSSLISLTSIQVCSLFLILSLSHTHKILYFSVLFCIVTYSLMKELLVDGNPLPEPLLSAAKEGTAALLNYLKTEVWEQEDNAARKIQRLWHSYAIRQRFRNLVRLTLELNRQSELLQQFQSDTRRRLAATKIQAWWRSYAIRMHWRAIVEDLLAAHKVEEEEKKNRLRVSAHKLKRSPSDVHTRILQQQGGADGQAIEDGSNEKKFQNILARSLTIHKRNAKLQESKRQQLQQSKDKEKGIDDAKEEVLNMEELVEALKREQEIYIFDKADDEGQALWSTQETDSTGKPLLKAASVIKLVEHLTSPNNHEKTFLVDFLMTYPTFMRPQVLLQLLTIRYFKPLPLDYYNKTEEEQQTYTKKSLTLLHMRVLQVLKVWIEEYPSQFKDDPQLQRNAEDFIEEMKEENKNIAPVFVELLDMLRGQSASLLRNEQKEWTEYMLHLQTSAPKPILSRGQSRMLSEEKKEKRELMESQHNVATTECNDHEENEEGLNILDFNAQELARQATLIAQEFFRKVQPIECLGQAFNKSTKQSKAPNIMNIVENFNQMSAWVVHEIVKEPKKRNRVAKITKFVQFAQECEKLNNLHTAGVIATGLCSSAISRLKKTWAAVSDKTKEAFEHLQQMVLMVDNFKHYREKFKTIQPPAVPFLVVFLADMTFGDEGNPNNVSPQQHSLGTSNNENANKANKNDDIKTENENGNTNENENEQMKKESEEANAVATTKDKKATTELINWEKRRLMARLIRKNLLNFQKTRYVFEPVYFIQRKLLDLPSQDSLDQNLLYSLSLDCEPRGTTAESSSSFAFQGEPITHLFKTLGGRVQNIANKAEEAVHFGGEGGVKQAMSRPLRQMGEKLGSAIVVSSPQNWRKKKEDQEQENEAEAGTATKQRLSESSPVVNLRSALQEATQLAMLRRADTRPLDQPNKGSSSSLDGMEEKHKKARKKKQKNETEEAKEGEEDEKEEGKKKGGQKKTKSGHAHSNPSSPRSLPALPTSTPDKSKPKTRKKRSMSTAHSAEKSNEDVVEEEPKEKSRRSFRDRAHSLSLRKKRPQHQEQQLVSSDNNNTASPEYSSSAPVSSSSLDELFLPQKHGTPDRLRQNTRKASSSASLLHQHHQELTASASSSSASSSTTKKKSRKNLRSESLTKGTASPPDSPSKASKSRRASVAPSSPSASPSEKKVHAEKRREQLKRLKEKEKEKREAQGDQKHHDRSGSSENIDKKKRKKKEKTERKTKERPEEQQNS
ncbi:Son of sevenless 2 [Balamuthia mandrillaris]